MCAALSIFSKKDDFFGIEMHATLGKAWYGPTGDGISAQFLAAKHEPNGGLCRLRHGCVDNVMEFVFIEPVERRYSFVGAENGRGAAGQAKWFCSVDGD